MVERIKERFAVKLIDGTDAEVFLYKNLLFREKQRLMATLTKDMTAKSVNTDVNLQRVFSVIEDMANFLWADQNYVIDDVEADSLSEVMIERFNTLFHGSGFEAEKRNDVGSPSGENQESKD